MTDVSLHSAEGRASSLWWAIIVAPIVQDIFFVYIPYRFLYRAVSFWEIAIISSALFAFSHRHFGRLFVIYAFLGGCVAWLIMVNYGILAVIIFHSSMNVLDWKIGIRRILTKGKYKL